MDAIRVFFPKIGSPFFDFQKMADEASPPRLPTCAPEAKSYHSIFLIKDIKKS